MRAIAIALAALIASPVLATGAHADDIERREAEGGVDLVAQRLETAVATAGGTIFATIDHAAGAQSIGEPIRPMKLIVFGNPQLGTPAIAENPLAGLYLPMKVLVYEGEDGKTWLAWEEPDETFDDLADDDAPWLEKMEEVMDGFIEAATRDAD